MERLSPTKMPRKIWNNWGKPLDFVYPLSEAETRVQKLEKEYNEVLKTAKNAYIDYIDCCYTSNDDFKRVH